ncbi:MAG TPA: nucleotidyltransferase family protein [Xanthomonadales bacterium]|nr:nucleotidyltransferase family protein [Xanthomonadales bacterium]
MCRCLALATEQPEGLLNTPNHIIDRFLCQALRGEPAPWEELPGNIAVDELNERCQHHGVQALLYHTMHMRHEWPGWPPGLRRELEIASKAGIAQDLLRAHYLQQLLNGLRQSRVRVVLTKGEALAASLYAIPGTRARCDSDLFIPIADLMRAQQVVHEAGFEIHAPTYKSHQFTVARKVDPSCTVRFDIHWRIQNAPRFARAISFEEAYAGSVELADMGGIRVLDAADALMLACMHRCGNERHDRDRLIWIYDIHLLISSLEELRLREFAQQAVNRNVQQVCLDGVSRAKELFHTHVPSEVLELLDSPEPKQTWSRRFAESNLGLLVDDWKKLPNRQARLGLLQELFMPSTEALMNKYHKTSKAWLPFLYLRQIVGGFKQRLLLR